MKEPEIMTDGELLEELEALLDAAEEKFMEEREVKIREDRERDVRDLRAYLRDDVLTPYMPQVLVSRLREKGLISGGRG